MTSVSVYATSKNESNMFTLFTEVDCIYVVGDDGYPLLQGSYCPDYFKRGGTTVDVQGITFFTKEATVSAIAAFSWGGYSLAFCR